MYRGRSLKVTLWGGVGDSLIEKKTTHVRMCAIVLTSMTAMTYNNKLYLSSTSSKVIYDNDDISSLQELRSMTSLVEPNKEMMMADSSQPREGTVKNLLLWARNYKNDTVTFQCKVMIKDIKRKSGWNYPSCGGEKYRKNVSIQGEKKFPMRDMYRLEVVVDDDTAHTVVVMFNEIATELLNCSVDSLIEAEDESAEDDSGLPTAMKGKISLVPLTSWSQHINTMKCIVPGLCSEKMPKFHQLTFTIKDEEDARRAYSYKIIRKMGIWVF
ncbi:DNA helicase PIF1, ATP-dependent [Tanacetum coccineum]|uniref:DNA helicase PIF1, ATP-dependent n=1 Tax=Tanacetum coccineum TaxID=301880 RepID=A0ABQ5ABC2_9ASTR